MQNSQQTIIPAQLEQIRDQLENWRQTRQKRSPIPETIWQAAAGLVAEHGLHRVTKTLRLNYPDLKRRVTAAAITESSPSTKAAVGGNMAPGANHCAPAFVALDWEACLAPAPCVVEIENHAGTKMKISLRQPGAADLAALVTAAFGKQAP